ncbi:MAG: rimO [Haloplasmataceae bacterium]|jgi:ribosomal protein S12 methylthiotransferase|nr:rimO [Haloplasmataceae bacterium]
MKIGMVSLGCSKNLVDSEMVLGLAVEAGATIVNDPKDADIIMVNTCGFIESAKKEAIDTILEMVEYKKDNKKLVVMGCLAQRYAKELKDEIPEVDRFITIKDYDNIGSILKELTEGELTFGETLQHFNRVLTTPSHLAYVRIAEGCNNNCSYCAIPLIRGRFKSRSMEDIIKETKALVSKGVKEIVLISQDTTRYGRDLKNTNLHILIENLAQIEGIEFLRFLYLYPSDVTDELIDVVSKYENITPYFDIPIQHASNKILKAMYRRGTKEELRSLFNKIRTKIPNAILRTTVIVGFPGETDEDFHELKSFVEEIKFDRLGAFEYSKEEDTKAYDFENEVDDLTKNKRFREIMKTQQVIAFKNNKTHIGSVHKAIVEGFDKSNSKYKTRSYAFAPDNIDGYLFVTSDETLVNGQVIHVEVTDTGVYGLYGKVIK